MQYALDSRFLQKLRCPASGQPLSFFADHPAQKALPKEETEGWSGVLLCADGRAFYPVRAGIPVLLVEELRPAEVGAFGFNFE
jgi:uncharacterized protein YbaR (Trm112 family)